MAKTVKPQRGSHIRQYDAMKKSTRTIIAENLRALMSASRSLTSQAQVAQKSGVAQSTIGRILREEVDARSDNLDAIGRSFGVRGSDLLVDGLLEGDNVAPGQAPRTGSRQAPVISWVQAGEWTEAVDMHSPGFGDDYEPVEPNDGPHVFWLRVVGDSMTAPVGTSIPEGYLIKVDPDAAPVSGSLVVAKLEETNEVTFKKLIIDAGQKYLKPLNPAYRTIPINGNCRIVGVVKEVRLKL